MAYKEIWQNTYDELAVENPGWTDTKLEEETEKRAIDNYSAYCDNCYEQVRERDLYDN